MCHPQTEVVKLPEAFSIRVTLAKTGNRHHQSQQNVSSAAPILRRAELDLPSCAAAQLLPGQAKLESTAR